MTPIDELKIFYNAGSNFKDALRVLSSAPLSEICIILDKINYYLEHINIIDSINTLKKDEEKIKTKKDFLQRIQAILLTEIERRNSLSI